MCYEPIGLTANAFYVVFGTNVSHASISLLYYDIAGISDPIAFNAIRALVGPSRLLFGTDYPFWSPQVAVATPDKLGVAGAERESIERGNALALIPGLADRGVTATDRSRRSAFTCS